MTPHAGAPALNVSAPYFAMPGCPRCGDTILAPEISAHVSTREVRHIWSCDTCGHEFTTSVDPFRWRRA
jgi:hypothetical protein